jgi:hypothetical protein
MVQPLETARINIVLRAKWPFVQSLLGALINDCAFVAGERGAILFAFQKILADLRADFLENKPNMGGKRIITEYRVPRLNQIESSKRR